MKEDNTYYDGMDGVNLPGSLRATPFMVPENYFEQLASSVLSQTHLPYISHPKKTDFSVPKNYFPQLTSDIQLRLKLEPYRDNEPEVPADYFERLSARIQTKVFEEKLKAQIPNDGFAVSAGHNDTLRDRIIARTIEEKPQKAKIRKLNFRLWVQYAAAACVAMVLGVLSYNLVDKGPEAKVIESQLASIPDEEIFHYLSSSNNSDDIFYIMEYMYQPNESEGVCSKIEENDIEDYLNYML